MANFIYDSITDKPNNTKQAYDIFENAVGCSSSFTFYVPSNLFYILPFRKSVPTVCFPNFDVYSYISKFFAQFKQRYFEFCLLHIE